MVTKAIDTIRLLKVDDVKIEKQEIVSITPFEHPEAKVFFEAAIHDENL